VSISSVSAYRCARIAGLVSRSAAVEAKTRGASKILRFRMVVRQRPIDCARQRIGLNCPDAHHTNPVGTGRRDDPPRFCRSLEELQPARRIEQVGDALHGRRCRPLPQWSASGTTLECRKKRSNRVSRRRFRLTSSPEPRQNPSKEHIWGITACVSTAWFADSALERNGFEPSVPRSARTGDSATVA
jgi:hypothetical protein